MFICCSRQHSPGFENVAVAGAESSHNELCLSSPSGLACVSCVCVCVLINHMLHSRPKCLIHRLYFG